MKITWVSNAPWAPTGYGTQTDQVTRRMKAAGHDVAIAANYGLTGRTLATDAGIPIFPTGTDVYSNDAILAEHAKWTDGAPGWIISLYDVWVYNRDLFRGQNFASWTPVDHFPVPPNVRDWAREHYTIAMSQFGQGALKEAGIDARYAPHAIDLGVYKPGDRSARDIMKVSEDAFLVVVNAANKGNYPCRKSWPELLSAFVLFSKNHPDAYLYLHTDLDGLSQAPNLTLLMKVLDIDASRVRVVPQVPYRLGEFTNEQVAAFYNAGDVLLSPSMGEGFGLSVIEAQACGLPVIVTDFSAQKELVGAGWKVGYQPWWDHMQASFMALPSITGIVKALEAAYEARGDQELRKAAVTFAAQYDADRVFAEYWVPILAELEDKLNAKPRRVRRSEARARRKAKAA